MILHLMQPMTLTDLSNGMKGYRVGPGSYPLLIVPSGRPSGALWGVVNDTSIGLALGYLQWMAREHDWIRLEGEAQ